MMDNNFSYYTSYNNVIFIESLSDESKTGKWLYDDLVSYTYKPSAIAMNYMPVANKKEFIEVFLVIREAVYQKGALPILHLDFHGDQDGFEIQPSGEFIHWSEWRDILVDLNIGCKNNLIVCMNVCEGFYSIFNSYDNLISGLPCPFYMCIGSQHKLINIETRDSYQVFYRELFTSNNFAQAVTGLNFIKNIHNIALADNMVLDMVKQLSKYYKSRQYKSKSNDELNIQFKHDIRFKDINFKRSSQKYMSEKRKVKQKVIIGLAEKYLMIDLYPELRDKYKIADRIISIT